MHPSAFTCKQFSSLSLLAHCWISWLVVNFWHGASQCLKGFYMRPMVLHYSLTPNLSATEKEERPAKRKRWRCRWWWWGCHAEAEKAFSASQWWGRWSRSDISRLILAIKQFLLSYSHYSVCFVSFPQSSHPVKETTRRIRFVIVYIVITSTFLTFHMLAV